MKIAIGGDHAGYEYKKILLPLIEKMGYEIKDFGPYSADSVDYPDFVHPIATALQKKEFDLGILICGSANGVAMTANKHKDIRAAICWDIPLAELARSHNNANILCLPARFVSEELAKKITEKFLTTDFEGGRHADRVNKINC
jgi:ribose 5-phosphate isomerase B